jgi:L,D-transpeptidase catalytic domain
VGAMRRLAAVAASIVVVVVASVPAWAQAGSSVTLSVSAGRIAYGQTVTLDGAIAPATRGQTVGILDESDAVVATATTDPTGAFSASIAPERTLTLRAVWGSATSDAVTVRVRAVVSVRMSAVRLFDTVAVRGTVAPAVRGARVEVSLLRSGRAVATARPKLGGDGRFAAEMRVTEPGTYRVRATFADDAHLRGGASDGPDATPLPNLRQGSHGAFVRLLERRLVELHYRLEGIDRRYDVRTADAVVAFRKVQGMDRVFTVTPAVWRALADPVVPRPRSDIAAFHFEVDQTHQVLLTVDRGEVTSISHISTGKPSTPTHDGSFRVYRKVAALTSGGLYWPSYFDGLRALHGYVEVPTYPASHGCVRIPYWNAKWVYRHAPIGTRVIVYHT